MTSSTYQARGADDQVHVVVGDGPVLGSPAQRTLCGRAVLVVYEYQVGTTCWECSRGSGTNHAPVWYEPCG